MNKEEKIIISVNEEDVQNIINAYEKDIEYINQLEKELEQLKEIEKEHQRTNGELREEIKEYQKELEKADSITQSCIFNGKKESEISYRKALNELEKTNKANQELKDRIDKAVDVINTQMKNADEGIKENLRIIKFNLIKGSCTFEDLKTEEDYKY